MAAVEYDLDIYKVPRASVDVEALAQGLARYLQMTAEDTEVLSQDPTRRDKLIAELYKQPGLKPNCYASQFVPPGGDPDAHLIPANAEIAKLTPPKSFEDRVNRLHLAFAAMMVYDQYKIGYALLGMPDLERRVRIRRVEIMNEWRRNVFHVQFPPRRRGYGTSRMPSTPPTQASIPTPPPTRYSPKQVSNDDALNFLSNPHTLIGKEFVHSSPEGADQEDNGSTWEVISYTVKKGEDGGVDHEYQVILEAFGKDPVPMGKEELQYLLQYSTVAM